MSSTPPPYNQNQAPPSPAHSDTSSGIAGIQQGGAPLGQGLQAAAQEAVAFIQGFQVGAPQAQVGPVPQGIFAQLAPPIFGNPVQPIFQGGGGAFQLFAPPPPPDAESRPGSPQRGRAESAESRN